MEPRKEKREYNAPAIRRPRPKLQIVKLEQRIAPRISLNHNETLVRQPVKTPQVRKEEPKPKLVAAPGARTARRGIALTP